MPGLHPTGYPPCMSARLRDLKTITPPIKTSLPASAASHQANHYPNIRTTSGIHWELQGNGYH